MIRSGIKGLFNSCLALSSFAVLAHSGGPGSHAGYHMLSTYQELQNQLERAAVYANKPIQIGPLIVNGANGGLINIDQALPTNLPLNYQACAGLQRPSIRQAVICTIEPAGAGNTDPNKIGWSTQNRALLAARMGNPMGIRVMVITQQHGNEPAGTEAALRLLRWLSLGYGRTTRQILTQLDILMLIRANPDGGEPDAENCLLDPGVGEVFQSDCGLIRQNVDPSAGGGFLRDSEAGFSGIVGRGYDLNRYHFVKLDNPIRPVETQAMVAAALAFRPQVVLDLHGDLQKTDCQLNYASIKPGQILGSLPTVDCVEQNRDDFRLFSPFADAIPGSPQEDIAQSLAAGVMRKVDRWFTGSVGRFSQVELGAGNIANGATANYQYLGAAAGGWETVNFNLGLRADVVAVTQGQPSISVNPGLPDPKLLYKQIWLNQIALHEALKTLAKYAQSPPTDTADFCNYPLASTITATLPGKYWGALAVEDTRSIPIAPEVGVPLYISGNCPDNPL